MQITDTQARKHAADFVYGLCDPNKPTSIIIDGNSLSEISQRSSESLDVLSITQAIESRTTVTAKTWYRIDLPETAHRTERYNAWLRTQGITPITTTANRTETEQQTAKRDIFQNLKYKVSDGNTILIGSSRTAQALANYALTHTSTRLIWIWDDMASVLSETDSPNMKLIRFSEIAPLARPPHKCLHEFHRAYLRYLDDKKTNPEPATPTTDSDLEIMVDRITASQDAMASAHNIGITDDQIRRNAYKDINRAITRHLRAE